jgi:predicted outer membrane repeat protein
MTLTGCTFRVNSAGLEGGGIFSDSGATLTVRSPTYPEVCVGSN